MNSSVLKVSQSNQMKKKIRTKRKRGKDRDRISNSNINRWGWSPVEYIDDNNKIRQLLIPLIRKINNRRKNKQSYQLYQGWRRQKVHKPTHSNGWLDNWNACEHGKVFFSSSSYISVRWNAETVSKGWTDNCQNKDKQSLNTQTLTTITRADPKAKTGIRYI